MFEISKAGKPSLLPPPPKIEAGRRLMDAMDAINARYGKDSIKYSAQGGQRPRWALRRDMLSPLSTTDWEDLPRVIA